MTKNILLVEDEAIIRFDLEIQLGELGYNVVSTARGEEAIELAEKEDIHLIIMDILLAGDMDGIEATKIIRSKANIPVIFCTAVTTKETLEKIDFDFDIILLKKPFNEEELRKVLNDTQF